MMARKFLAVAVFIAVTGGMTFAFTDTDLPGTSGIQQAIGSGATPEEAVVTVMKKTLMCPSLVGCAEIVTAAISLYPDKSKDIVAAAVMAAPSCQTEICQGAIEAGMDPTACGEATAAGRRPPSAFESVAFPELGIGRGGVTSPS